MMPFAEHITPEGLGSARAIGFEHQQPLQIRMNPFVAGRSRAPIFEARIYLGERAISIGRPNLFTPEALDVVIRGTRGALGELRAVAELAFFAAASGGASQIGPMHILRALESRIGYNEDVVVEPDQEISGSEIDTETMIQGLSASSPVSAIISDVVQPPAAETLGDAPSQSTDAADDEPAQRAQAENVSFRSGRGGTRAGIGRRIAHAAGITAVLLVTFAIAGLVSSQLLNGKSKGAKSVSMPISKPADFALAVVAPPAAPVTESSTLAPSSLVPIGAESDPSVGGGDSARAAAAAKVVAAKRKRPRARRRARAANPVAEQVSAEVPATATVQENGESGTP